MKITSKADFAARLGISRAAVTQATNPGRGLNAALDASGNIIIDSHAALEFLGKYEIDPGVMVVWGLTDETLSQYRPANGVLKKSKSVQSKPQKHDSDTKPKPAIVKKTEIPKSKTEYKPKSDDITKPGKDDDESIANREMAEDVNSYLDLTVRQVIDRFGTDSNFKNVLDARKTIEEIKRKEFDNRMKAGEFIPRDTVKKHIFPFIDNAFLRLVEDLPGTLARQIKAKALADATDEEITEFAREKISLTIKGIKDSAVKRLADV